MKVTGKDTRTMQIKDLEIALHDWWHAKAIKEGYVYRNRSAPTGLIKAIAEGKYQIISSERLAELEALEK